MLKINFFRIKMGIILYFIFLIHLIKLIYGNNNFVNISVFCDICCEYFENIQEINLTIMNEKERIEINNKQAINITSYKSKKNIIIISYNNTIKNFIFLYQNSICDLIEKKEKMNYNIKKTLLYSEEGIFKIKTFSFILKNQLRKLYPPPCTLLHTYYQDVFIANQSIFFSAIPKYQCMLESTSYLPPIISYSFPSPGNGIFNFISINPNYQINFNYIPSTLNQLKYKSLTLNYNYKLDCINDITCNDQTHTIEKILCPYYCYDCKIIDNENNKKKCYSNYTFNQIHEYIEANDDIYCQNEEIVNENYIFYIFPSNTNYVQSINNVLYYSNDFCSRIIRYYKNKINTLHYFRVESNYNNKNFNCIVYDSGMNVVKRYKCIKFDFPEINLIIHEHLYFLNFLDFISPDYDINDPYYLKVTFINNCCTDRNQGKFFFELNKINEYVLDKYVKMTYLYYVRNGYYYNELFRYEMIYDLIINNEPKIFYEEVEYNLKNYLNITVYPHYCTNQLDLLKRKCYTNYSLISMQKELEDTDLSHLHEHYDETIIGNNFQIKIYTYNSDFFNKSGPLHKCNYIYKKYNESVDDLIYIEYKYENEIFYKMYDRNYDKEGHEFCDIGICYIYEIKKDIFFIIYNNENLIININDYLKPNVLDNNTEISFKFFFSDKSKMNEITENSNNILNSGSSSKSRKFIYSTEYFYFTDDLILEIYHLEDEESTNMIGSFKIYVLPEYCNKLLSNVNNRICYTNLTIESMKNKIISDSLFDYFPFHDNETIYGINYILFISFKEPLENSECYNLLKNYYETDDFILFDIKEENKKYIELYAKKDNRYYYANLNLCDGIFLYNITKIIDINSEYKINILNYISDLIPSYINLDLSNNLEKYSFIFYRLNENGNYEHFINSDIISNNNFIITFIPDDYKYYQEKFKYVLIKRNSTDKDYVVVNIESEITFNIFPSYCKSYQKMNCLSKKNMEEILEILDNDYKNFENHNGEIIQNNDFYIQINTIDNNKKNYVELIVGFENCKNDIKSKYNLKEEDEIYIMNMKKTNSDKITFKIYSPLIEKELEINDICKFIEVENTIHFNYNILTYKNFLNEGIDIFNINSLFYYDLCNNYKVNGKDILLYDRFYEYYPNINVCSINCKYESFDLSTNLIKCICPINQIVNLDIYGNYINFSQNNYKNIIKKKRSHNYFKNFNFKILKCVKGIKNNINNNYGFWFMIFLLIIHLISLFSYFYFNLHTLNQVIKIPFINAIINKHNYIHQNNNSNDLVSSEREINNMKKINNDNKINEKIYELSFDSISFSYAIFKDKRTTLKMFIELIKEKNPILRSYYSKYIFDLHSINVSLFVIHTSLIFNLNIIFYNNNIISNKFYNKSCVIYDFIRIILSSFLTYIIFSFYKDFFPYIELIEQLLFELKTKRMFLKTIIRHLKQIKFKLGYMMSINTLIIIFFLFYSSIFCALYKNNQNNWFIGGIISLMINYITCFLFCLIITLIRKKSLRIKNEELYNISVILRKII